MKSSAIWEIVRVIVGGIGCLTATGLLLAKSESLPYHFVRFEESEGYQVGNFKDSGAGFQLLQGDARIVREKGDDAVQCMETVAGRPYSSIYFRGERVSQDQKTYYEIWVRPSTSPLAKSEEFMDLDGAVLGFFSEGPDQPATFHAYHALPDHQGHWVSTGVSAVVGPSGMTQEWIQIGICQNLATGTWDLKIGGELILREIRIPETLKKDGIEVWLLGHETFANRFDDLLISPVDPEVLRLGDANDSLRNRSADPGQSENLDRSGERKVGRKQGDQDRRRYSAGIPDSMQVSAPKLHFEMDIVDGGTQHGKFDGNTSDTDQSYLLYSPQYNKDGNPLPIKMRIRCDAQLAEGVDLSKIVWALIPLPTNAGEKTLQVIAHGDFKSGFTQTVEIPAEWASKGTSIRVGTGIRFLSSP